MNPDLSQKALNKIETLCEQGCSHVNQILANAENGNDIDELSDFSHTEIKQIIDELGKIMSVYDSHHDDDNNCDNNENTPA